MGFFNTLSGIGSAVAGNSFPLNFPEGARGFDATPGSALITWEPPQPARSVAAAAPKKGARFMWLPLTVEIVGYIRHP
jgi:hypothetical protein